MSDLVEFKDYFKLLRTAQGLTQEYVAFESNLSVERLQRIERGHANLRLDTVICISKSLGVDSRVIWFFSRTDADILSEFRSGLHLPERDGDALQVCKNILLLRKENHLTQTELARVSGVSHTCIRNIEKGCENVTTKTLLRIAAAFDLSLMKLTHLATNEERLIEMVYAARSRAGIRV